MILEFLKMFWLNAAEISRLVARGYLYRWRPLLRKPKNDDQAD
jgi:hypothetical protein